MKENAVGLLSTVGTGRNAMPSYLIVIKDLMKFVLVAHGGTLNVLFETLYKFCDAIKRYVV